MRQDIFTFDEPGHHLFATCEVAGGFFAKDRIFALQAGDEVQLEAEPANPHDPHAIAVLSGDDHLGYIPAKTGNDVNKLVGAVLAQLPIRAFVCCVDHNPNHTRNRVRLALYANTIGSPEQTATP